MKKKAVMAFMLGTALVMTGCSSGAQDTAKETQAVTEAETSSVIREEETTVLAEEATTEETATEEATTEEATTEEATTEEATTEETTTGEAATEETTTEAGQVVEPSSEDVTETESESETEKPFSMADRPTYTALDYVTLGEYKGLKVVQAPVEISEEDIQSMIDVETVETLTEGTVEDGDTVNIDYVGEIDGKEFDGGSAEGYSLKIGSGSFIDGFETGLIGAEIGGKVDLNLKFPDNYHSEDVAGKDVVFHVTVNSADRVPELTDEVAAKVSDGKTAEEYVESIREELAESAAATRENEINAKLVSQVYENAVIDGYPIEYLEFNMNMAKDYYEQMAQMYGMSLTELLQAQGMDEETFFAQLEEVMKESMGQEMAVKAVAEAENMTIDDGEYQEGLKQYAEEMSIDAEQLESEYGKDYIRDSLLLDKAMRFLSENAIVVEEEETEAEAGETEIETAAAETKSETAAMTETESDTAEAKQETVEEISEEIPEEELMLDLETEAETKAETETEK